MINKFLTGSRYFFDGMPGFVPKDSDYLQLVPYQKELYTLQVGVPPGQDLFSWRANEPVSTYVDYILAHNDPYILGSFIQADFAAAIGARISDLEKLLPVAKKLNTKHKYVGIILKFYIANNGFFLTDEQRRIAYADYQTSRANLPLFSTKDMVQSINKAQQVKIDISKMGEDD